MAEWNAYYQNEEEEEEEQEDGEQFRGKLGHFLYSTLIFTVISVISTLSDYIFSSMWWCSVFLFDCIPKKTASQLKLKSDSLFIIRLQSHRERQLGVSG